MPPGWDMRYAAAKLFHFALNTFRLAYGVLAQVVFRN